MRRMAGRGIAKCCSPPEAHRGDEGYGVRPPTLAAWLRHNGAGTSGANWLHYNYWVSTFKGAHSLILPAHSGEVRVDHHANISRKVPLWPVCVGGPRGKKWSWVDPSLPSSLEAWNKLMHAANGNTAPAGASGDASGAYYLLCCNGLQYEGKNGFASCPFILI